MMTVHSFDLDLYSCYHKIMKTKAKATIITADGVSNTIYNLPNSWKRALGILQHKRIDPLRYQKTIRKDWAKRLHKQQRLAS